MGQVQTDATYDIVLLDDIQRQLLFGDKNLQKTSKNRASTRSLSNG